MSSESGVARSSADEGGRMDRGARPSHAPSTGLPGTSSESTASEKSIKIEVYIETNVYIYIHTHFAMRAR